MTLLHSINTQHYIISTIKVAVFQSIELRYSVLVTHLVKVQHNPIQRNSDKLTSSSYWQRTTLENSSDELTFDFENYKCNNAILKRYLNFYYFHFLFFFFYFFDLLFYIL